MKANDLATTKRDQINQFLQLVFCFDQKLERKEKNMKYSKSESWQKFYGKKQNYLRNKGEKITM